MPEDLRGQIERIREMIDAFNIPRIEVENYEADDVIGSLAKWAAEKEGLGVKIITGDRDLLQLVTNRIVVSLPNSRTNTTEEYFPEDVKRKLGVYPEQVVDYKALVGDPSDNIPGVKGIGEKTAIKLLEQYSNLDEIYAHLDEIGGRTAELLRAGRDSAYLSRDLARIRTDLNVKLDLAQAELSNSARSLSACIPSKKSCSLAFPMPGKKCFSLKGNQMRTKWARKNSKQSLWIVKKNCKLAWMRSLLANASHSTRKQPASSLHKLI